MHKNIQATAFLLTFSFASVAFAQSPTPQLESCKKVCSALSGQCNVSLVELARTPCFDTKKKTARTCDCNLSLDGLQALKETDTVRDCVFPRSLIGLGGRSVDIAAKLNNVHMRSISNLGSLDLKGDIKRSTICSFRCVGRNRFQNCRILGNVIKSTFRDLEAQDEASLVILGNKFARNKVDFIVADAQIQISCKDGFDKNNIGLMATSRFGKFSSTLGTKIRDNRFGTISFNEVVSFAELDGNTADSASVNGPCSVLSVKTKIIADVLTLPPGDAKCAQMFEKS